MTKLGFWKDGIGVSNIIKCNGKTVPAILPAFAGTFFENYVDYLYIFRMDIFLLILVSHSD